MHRRAVILPPGPRDRNGFGSLTAWIVHETPAPARLFLGVARPSLALKDEWGRPRGSREFTHEAGIVGPSGRRAR